MEKDFSKLLPALFNDKDLCFTELMENFFAEFDGTYCCNVQGTTFVGFIDDQEVRVHAVVNRIELEFYDGFAIEVTNGLDESPLVLLYHTLVEVAENKSLAAEIRNYCADEEIDCYNIALKYGKVFKLNDLR